MVLFLVGGVTQTHAACAQSRADASSTRELTALGNRIATSDLADAIAPTFWYSTAERYRPIALPCFPDPPVGERPIYWQARGDRSLLEPGAEIDIGQFEELSLRFFLYYERDYGVGGHEHDVEYVDIAMRPRCVGGECALVIESIVTSAHKEYWNYNRYIPNDTSWLVLPPNVLVEHGKHAMALDANDDGRFTAGIDVTRGLNDAWGIRDNMGEGYLGPPQYQGWMTVDRRAAGARFGPSDYELVPSREALDRGGGAESFCREVVAQGHSINLRRRLEELGFAGLSTGPLSTVSRLFGGGGRVEYDRWAFRPGYEVRLDKLRVGVMVTPFGIPFDRLGGGWLVPRVMFWNVGHLKDLNATPDPRSWALQIAYMPSASRWADWYAAMGYQRYLAEPVEPQERDGEFLGELGLKLRTQLGLSFAPFKWTWGIRMGVAFTETSTRGVIGLGHPFW